MYPTLAYRIEGVSRSLLAELTRHRRLPLPILPPTTHDPDDKHKDTSVLGTTT